MYSCHMALAGLGRVLDLLDGRLSQKTDLRLALGPIHQMASEAPDHYLEQRRLRLYQYLDQELLALALLFGITNAHAVFA
jgi:hypothetical protein